MAFFQSVRPLLRIAHALEEIARALSYFAMADARANGRFYALTRPSRFQGKDESELLHTDTEAIAALRAEEEQIIEHRGYVGLEQWEQERE